MEVHKPKKRGPKPKKCKGRFFYIEKNQWLQVCGFKDADMQSAYAIMVRGANGENHKTTEWSVNSVEKRLKIPEWKAKAEIERLVNEGFLQRAGFVGEDTRRPIYEIVLPEKPEWICVPNSIVDGLNKGSKPSPLLQLKLVGNVLALRILIDLYSFLKLESVGGCSILWRTFQAEQICEWNAWKVWSFTDTSRNAVDPTFFSAYGVSQNEFWEAVNVLEGAGLIEFVPHLFRDGSKCHALRAEGRKSDAVEKLEMGAASAAHDAGCPILSIVSARTAARNEIPQWVIRREAQREHPSMSSHRYIVPVRNRASVEVMAVARLTHRPHNSETGAWVRESCNLIPEYIRDYHQLAEQANETLNQEVFGETIRERNTKKACA